MPENPSDNPHVRAGDLVESIIDVAEMSDEEVRQYLRDSGISDEEMARGAKALLDRIRKIQGKEPLEDTFCSRQAGSVSLVYCDEEGDAVQ